LQIVDSRLPHALAAIGGLLVVLTLQLAPRAALPAAAVSNCSTSRPGDSDSEEQTMLSLINAYRAQSGESPLSPSPNLARAALWKSADMAVNHYFGHDDLIRGWLQRIQDCGYPSSYDGENIAEGYADARETLQQWETSPPHNANLLNSSYHAIGVGRAQSAGGSWYWTADFGAVPDADSSTPSASGPQSLLSSASGSATIPALSTLPPASGAQRSVAAGQTAVVNTPNDCLRVHSSPSISSSVSACIPDGTSIFLVAGPVSADGYTWWTAYGAGWVAGQYLRPPS
jgi:uncharacterized protein YkwD